MAWYLPHLLRNQNTTMKQSKIVIALALSTLMLGACHTGKKGYIKKFHKEAKGNVDPAKISLKSDTVRVIYPELAMFDFGKDEIKTDAQTSLRRFAGVLAKYDKIDFIINGYTDNVGTVESNKDLSLRRADNAKALFEKSGVNGARMSTHGMGEANPTESNMTEEGKQANRRVELLMYEKK
jgi:outer membrane protein OmpA-like peptidoglycan-associated protein